MDEQHRVYLIGGEDDETALFTEEEAGDACKLTCAYRGRSLEAVADDFFDALANIRRQLEPEGLIPFCYGSSLNVFPSPMARQMGGGVKAYRLKTGQPAKTSDLVSIFDAGPDVIPAFVAPQEQFYREWLASLAA